jgi:hypothetical protein
MFSENGCTVTLADGTVLRRQRVVYEDGLFRSYDRRTMTLRLEITPLSVEATGKKKWSVTTTEGVITVTKSGCGCGR